MSRFNILGDYVAADFLPAAESSITGQLSFSAITKALCEAGSQEEEEAGIREVLQPFLAGGSDYLILDLQDTEMLAQPPEDGSDALRLSRSSLKNAVRVLAELVLEKYRPEQVVVNEHYVSAFYLEKAQFRFYENSTRISRYNMLMRFLFHEMEDSLQGCHWIPFPADVFDVRVLLEDGPEFQYHPRYYYYGQQAMQAVLGDSSADGRVPLERAAEEARISIAREKCGEAMAWLAGMPAIAAEEDVALRRRIRGLKAAAADSSWIELEWDENIYAPAYLVESYGNGIWEQIEVIDGEQAPYCWISGLKPDTEYYFRVTVQADEDCRRYSQEVICRTLKEGSRA